jgi:O-antigen/teichoic acid export membrane protein
MSPTAEPEPEREEGHLGGLVRHSAIYSAAPILRQLISIGMTHLYTRWLGGANFGVKGVIDLWMIGLQQLLGVNVLGAMVRFYYDQKSPEDRASVVTSCTLLVTLVAWVVCGTAFLFSSTLQPLMLPHAGEVVAQDLVGILQLMLVLIPFQLSTQSGFYYLMAIKRSGLYTTIQTGKLIFEVALNFLLMGHLGWGVEGFMVSMLAGEALTSLLLCGWIFRSLGARIDWRILRPILAYAAPLVPVGICQLALHSMDRRLLVELTADDRAWAATGIYDLGYKIGFLVTTMLLGPFIQIFHPWIYDITDPEARSRHLARVGTWAVLAVAAATLGVILFGRQAAVILGGTREFWEAWRVIPFVAGGYVFWALYHVSQIPLFIAKRTGRLIVINLAALGINLGANIWLIPRYEFVGAGIATAVTFASLSVLGVLASRSEARVPFEVGRLTAIVTAVVAGAAFALWVDAREVADDLSTLAAIAVKAVACLVLVGVLWRLVLDGEERGGLSSWVRGLRRGG